MDFILANMATFSESLASQREDAKKNAEVLGTAGLVPAAPPPSPDAEIAPPRKVRPSEASLFDAIYETSPEEAEFAFGANVLDADWKSIQVKQAPANENIVPLENTYAQAVSFTEDEKSNNKIFYMDEDDVKRSKVGGIFKKFKRLVERTAKIKTGNSLKIAGFEIAAR